MDTEDMEWVMDMDTARGGIALTPLGFLEMGIALD